jgi:hypothetical protein
MGVDKTGKHQFSGRIDDFRAGRNRQARADLRNSLVLNIDIGAGSRIGVYDIGVPDQ